MSTRRRITAVLTTALASAALLAACEPAPPAPVLVVDPTTAGPDATPGDGTCATASGACSFRAAIDEANALGRADVRVGPGPGVAEELTVTAAVEISAVRQHADVAAVVLTVAEGATLHARNLQMGPTTVEGTASFRRVSFEGGAPGEPRALLEVGPSGRVVGINVLLLGWFGPAVRNAGVLALHGSTVQASSPTDGGDGASVTTLAGGSTTFGAVAIVGDPATANPACAGLAPTSLGHTLAFDTTCELDAVGDVEGADEQGISPRAGSLRLDAVPPGTLGCGEWWTDHFSSTTDGDPVRPRSDGAAPACDIGAIER